MAVYRGDRFPRLDGMILLGALAGRHLNAVSVEGSPPEEIRILEDLGERIRDVEVGPHGFIYLLADSGTLYQLQPEPD